MKTPQSGRTFGLNPYLTGVQNLFNAGRAAIVSNVGTLVAPTTKSQIQANYCSTTPLRSTRISTRQQHGRRSPPTVGVPSHTGWARAMADVIESMNTNSAFHLYLDRRSSSLPVG